MWPPGRLQTIDESIGHTFVADREGEILDPGRGRLLEALRFAFQGDVIMGCGLNARKQGGNENQVHRPRTAKVLAPAVERPVGFWGAPHGHSLPKTNVSSRAIYTAAQMNEREAEITVIIAAVGRTAQLDESLNAYERLDPETPPFEVIVVCDGVDPTSRELCGKPRGFPVRVLSQEPSGPGPARNLGAASARGELLVLLNDDTRPDPGCLLAHTSAQARLGPCVAIGRVEWDPDRLPTPYMKWLAPEGHQFNYGRLDPELQAPWNACWATNLAVPRDWLLEEPFDPDFPVLAVEDGEWGYRLFRSGRQLRYVPESVCFHDHRYEGPADFRQRARTGGAASRYVVRRHPELTWTLIGRPVTAAAIRAMSMLWPGNWRQEMLWDLDFRSNYAFGIVQPRRKDWCR